jgi:ribose 1,5-bisphosphokinase
MTAGQLVYLVGPSGAGKDSLIAAVKQKSIKNNHLYFAPRYVTRAAGGGHDDLPITTEAFAHYRLAGEFVLDWEAHGLCYGISKVIDQQMLAGKTVVVNGSRAYLATALQKYPALTVASITVAPAIARERLHARAREDAAAIAARLQRAPPLEVPPHQLVTIDNSGALEHAAQALARVLGGG